MPEYVLTGRKPRGPFIPPTPPPQPIAPATQQQIMGAGPQTAMVEALARALRSIPGVTPRVEGDRVGFRVEANSISELIQKLSLILATGQKDKLKMICEGEPVRIT